MLFRSEPLSRVVSKDQRDEPGFKPQGLWVSVDDAWKKWCLGAQFDLLSLERSYEVTLAASCTLLCLGSPRELQTFTARWTAHGPESYPSRYRSINWRGVAEKHDGILIDPYLWGCRFDEQTFWYYGWDCASGCIWRAEAIEKIVKLEKEPPK